MGPFMFVPAPGCVGPGTLQADVQAMRPCLSKRAALGQTVTDIRPSGGCVHE